MRRTEPPDTTDLEADIISTLEAIPASIPARMGDGVWTAAIKSSLIALGKKKDYRVCASGFPNECDNEWLYDLVWYRNDSSSFLREIGLILESEWNVKLSAIKYDFEKLLVARSPVKVMVFQDYQANLPQVLSLLETGIHSFQKSEPATEKYILAGYQNSKDQFVFKTITV